MLSRHYKAAKALCLQLEQRHWWLSVFSVWCPTTASLYGNSVSLKSLLIATVCPSQHTTTRNPPQFSVVFSPLTDPSLFSARQAQAVRSVPLGTMATPRSQGGGASRAAVTTTSTCRIQPRVTSGQESAGSASTTQRGLTVACARVVTTVMHPVAIAEVSKNDLT